MKQDEAFKAWWYTEGSQPPYTHHDCEEHCMRMCEIAWNEALKAEREACAKVCEETKAMIWEFHPYAVREAANSVCVNLAAAIRARDKA